MKLARALAILALCSSACAPGLAQIVETRDLPEASGAPAIASVTDLGGRDILLDGTLDVSGSDGIAVVGEALWIQGTSFGRQPTVTVGGQPAAVLARTGHGGILVRVPVATPAGLQPLVVSQEVGAAEKVIAVRRYAAVLPPAGGAVGFAEITPDGPVKVGFVEILDARHLCLSADGRAAYVIGDRGGMLTVIEMPAAREPRPVFRVELGNAPVRALLCPGAASTLLVVRDKDVVALDTTSPLRPARSAPRALPESLVKAGIAGVRVSPDGRWLAFALATDNRVVLIERARMAEGGAVSDLLVAPKERVPVIADLAFSPLGDTLWVLAGDTAASRPAGPQPVRVHAARIKVKAGRASLELARTVMVEDAADPQRLTTGRNLPLASGSAIRLPPERATVYFTAGSRDGKRNAVMTVGAEETAAQAAESQSPAGEPDVTPDGRWLLAGFEGADGSLRLLSFAVDGRPGAPRTVELIPAPAKPHNPADLRPAVVRVQP